MPRMRDSYISCGVKELFELSETPTPNLKAIASYGKNGKNYFAFVQWSDVVTWRYDVRFGLECRTPGVKFAEFITKTFPGTLTYTDAMKNPNTRNIIRIWTWAVPQTEFRKYVKKRWPGLKKSMPPRYQRHDERNWY